MSQIATIATPELTIIIPCFNCEKTLREAVESCYQQGLERFEIVMVDDCSDDGTRVVMEQLAQEYDFIKTFYHDTNQGGGATRNTATSHASSDLIFCLDSDDLLPPHTLDKMVNMQRNLKADGIGIETSIKFRGTDTTDIAYITRFGYTNEIVPLDSLLEREGVMCPLYSTFLYTKDSFDKIGGYPTEHGFDTQGFAWRFLSHGLKAYTCPNTTYLHRIDFHQSYYLTEYQAGRTNINWRLILLENNHVLSDAALEFVKNFKVRDFEKNLIVELRNIPQVFSDKPQKRNLNFGGLVTKPVARNSTMGVFYRVRSRLVKLLLQVMALNPIALGKLLATKTNDYVTFIRLVESPYALLAWHLMRIRKAMRLDFKTVIRSTDEVMDLIIPTIAKDFSTLHISIESIRKHLQHSVGNVYIVTRPNETSTNFCERHGYELIDESLVLGYDKTAISYFANGKDRSGWLLQQLIKLAGDTIAKTDNFISVDSDTVFLRPHLFLNDGKFIFRQNEEWHEPYFSTFQKMFGYRVQTWFSYTSHMMIFNKKMLKELKTELEHKHKKTWDQVYRDTADPEEISCISDYDTYANWVRCNYPEQVESVVLYNKTLPRALLTTLPELEKKYGDLYHSISFHSYVSDKVQE